MGKIEVKYNGDMLFETTIGSHTIKIDVPDVMGGKDRAMTPPQLFLAAFASCSAAFAAKYCNTAGIDATGMTVSLDFEKIEGKLTNFDMKLNVPNAPENRKTAILKAASHCPVKDSIESFEGVNINF